MALIGEKRHGRLRVVRIFPHQRSGFPRSLNTKSSEGSVRRFRINFMTKNASGDGELGALLKLREA